jgi:hypothetical protein
MSLSAKSIGAGVTLAAALFSGTFAPIRAEEPFAKRDNATQSDDATAREKARAARLERMQRVAADYDLLEASDTPRDAQKDKQCELQKTPVLRWSNPLRETDDGTVFLWKTAAGRPAAILSIYTHEEVNIDHEFQSLALTALAAKYRGNTVWQPARAGIEFQPAPGRPEPPAKTAASRLSQMRKLLGGFSASMGRDQWRHELRLLPQPFYRYGDKEGEVVDGAVFAFAQGTDPELLILVEARRRKGEPATWQYAPARLNMGNVELKHRDAVVWMIDAWDRRVDPAAPYVTFVHKVEE